MSKVPLESLYPLIEFIDAIDKASPIELQAWHEYASRQAHDYSNRAAIRRYYRLALPLIRKLMK